MAKIRVAQAYTGPIGSEIVRRLANHKTMELVGVLVHSDDKAGKDSGVVAGGAPNGIITTQSLDELIALKPQGIFWGGPRADIDVWEKILSAGVNLYTGAGAFFLKGRPEEARIAAACERGQSSICSGGNIPGLISDVLPSFLTGYTGRIRQIRCWQRNIMDKNPSAYQMQGTIGIGLPPGANPHDEAIRTGFTINMGQCARWLAESMGEEYQGIELIRVEYGVAPHHVELQPSGLVIEEGAIGGVRWTWVARASGRDFFRMSTEMAAMFGLGEGWRNNYEDPAYRVEIDGEPSMVCTLGWPSHEAPALANYSLNAVRALNTMPRLVAARPGNVTTLDYPAPVSSEGLAPL